jgi:hypothetical protein
LLGYGEERQTVKIKGRKGIRKERREGNKVGKG